ncbi:two-component sensor histidine kinase [Micromonospora sp. PLK6-60]|uniref:sensor histidine kinase n=1 Tax=Micromonospora sp. PLK6-60 TaxID=2873383 RepID=UPI001CA6FBEF|nr:histidine kinase [Micromonospora sp. PLK6-60]MBY8872266.1 two-component sensor histidine kinase [Micromonospora sp. PLK6-60]
MTVRRVLGPLVRGSTWRRGVFLLLGGVLALPYALLAATFAQMFGRAVVPLPTAVVLSLVAAVIAAVPVFLDGSRSLEIAAARSLLEVDLPDRADGYRLDRETRIRAALWIALHLVSGGLVLFAAISAFPMAVVFIAQQFGLDTGAGQALGPLAGRHPAWQTLVGVVLLVGLGYAVAGLGALAASMAPVLLGPSPAERIAALEARAARLAERNRLARELHDSVGHALTVATLQAGAARQLLDDDPEFTRRALTAIEETSRQAMDDLDHVLGLLRQTERGDPPVAEKVPQRTLAQLARLVDDTRATGLPVRARIGGDLAGLPPAVSREGYRIVQEGLTNAARHGRGPVRLRVGVTAGPTPADGGGASGGGRGWDGGGASGDDRRLEIELENELAVGGGRGGGGRGLDGMRERVLLLGGRMTAGPDGGRWRVRVGLPVPRGEPR